jgi:hypothetical protein
LLREDGEEKRKVLRRRGDSEEYGKLRVVGATGD